MERPELNTYTDEWKATVCVELMWKEFKYICGLSRMRIHVKTRRIICGRPFELLCCRNLIHLTPRDTLGPFPTVATGTCSHSREREPSVDLFWGASTMLEPRKYFVPMSLADLFHGDKSVKCHRIRLNQSGSGSQNTSRQRRNMKHSQRWESHPERCEPK